MPVRFRSLFAVCLFACSAFAATPYPVADLNRTINPPVDSTPSFLTKVNGAVLFIAQTGSPVQLFRSDGTAAGTFPLTTILTHGDGSLFSIASAVEGNVAYIGTRGDPGYQIWKTDGTVAGTSVLPLPVSFVALRPVGTAGSRFLYIDGQQLRAFDGTSVVTVATLQPGENFSTSATLGGVWYIGSNQGLWKSDGTIAGTAPITSGSAFHVNALNGRIVFAGTGAGTGIELWSADGTANGSHLITDLTPGIGSTFLSTLSSVAVAGTRMYFTGANGEIGVTDGTANGTRVLFRGPASTLALPIAVLNGIGYIAYADGVHGRELWRTDGTTQGTRMVRDLFARTDVRMYEPVAGDTRVYFLAGDGDRPADLYVSDGTEAGTHLAVAQHEPPWQGGYTSATRRILTLGDTAFFGVDDGVTGLEPWVSDGTDAGTHLLANLRPEVGGSSAPRAFAAGGDRLFFLADPNATTTGLWSSGGTAESTRLLEANLPGQRLPKPLFTAGNVLYLSDFGQLWRSDGTPGGLRQLLPGFHADDARVVAGHIYLNATGGLYALDEATQQPVQLSPFRRTVIELAGRAYFQAEADIYTTDGTAAGTRRVVRLSPEKALSPLMAFGGSLLALTGDSADNGKGTTLRAFSGSPGESRVLATFPSGSTVAEGSFASIGTSLLFAVRQAGTLTLWKTDGTAAGTVAVPWLALPAPQTSALTSLGDRALFLGRDEAHGIEPWVSDGTAAGTRMLRDINPSPLISSVSDPFVVADGVAYFAADDGTSGLELWQTDGTEAGTHLVADISPGAASSLPSSLTRAGNLLYFAATTNATGTELWALPLTEPAITIGDARAQEHERRITIPVRLTGPSSRRITVAWETIDGTAKAGRDYTAATGTLTFEAGELAKTIVITINDDDTAAVNRAFQVRLHDASAPLERVSAGAIIEEDDVRADLSVALTIAGGRPAVTVRNAGPSIASNVRLCFTATPQNNEPLCTELYEMAPGATVTSGVSGSNDGTDFLIATVTDAEPDPTPNDHMASWAHSGSYLFLEPPLLRAGESGTLHIVNPVPSNPYDQQMLVFSSDPSILSIPVDAITFAPGQAISAVTITAHQAGTVTIIAAGTTFNAGRITVRVTGPSDPLRVEAAVRVTVDGTLRFGAPSVIIATVDGTNPVTGAHPTGTVTLSDRGVAIATAPLVQNRATFVLNDLRPGSRLFTATYNGDANFLSTPSLVSPSFATRALASFTVTPVAGTSNLVIAVRGVAGQAPTGTIAIAGIAGSQPLTAAGASTSSAIVSGIAASAKTLTITYSGDDYYESATLPVAITGAHRRATGR